MGSKRDSILTVLVNFISIALIVASVSMIFMKWISLDGVKSKDLKNWRENVSSFSDRIGEVLNYEIDGVDLSKSQIKKAIKKFDSTTKIVLQGSLSPIDVCSLCVTANGLVKSLNEVVDAGVLENYVKYLKVTSKEYNEFVDVYEGLAGFSYVFYAYIAFIVVMCLLALGAVLFSVFNKCNVFHILYFILMLVLVAAFVAIKIGVNGAFDEMSYKNMPKNMELVLSAYPFIALACSLLSFVLRSVLKKVFNLKKPKKQEMNYNPVGNYQ